MSTRFFFIFFLCFILNSCTSTADQSATPPTAVQEGSLTYGNPNAPVTIMEFTDFECHFCGQAQPTLRKVLEAYPNEVKLVFKNFPLSFHPHARQAHLAVMCADEQGKFWDYRNMLFDNQKALTRADLSSYASNLKLNEEQFSQCLDQEKYALAVEADFQEGVKAGVMGTPTFSVNGHMISGAQSFGAFDKLIKQALEEKS